MDKIFTHTDLDGVGCAVLAKYYNPAIEVEFCDYDNVDRKVSDFLDNNIALGDLYITDISVSDDIAQRLDYDTDFILLDHHPTALDLNKYKCCTVKVEDEKLLFSIIRASFNQRRKTLQNGLGHVPELGISKEMTVQILEEMGLPPSVRGETMTLAQFADFTNRAVILRMQS